MNTIVRVEYLHFCVWQWKKRQSALSILHVITPHTIFQHCVMFITHIDLTEPVSLTIQKITNIHLLIYLLQHTNSVNFIIYKLSGVSLPLIPVIDSISMLLPFEILSFIAYTTWKPITSKLRKHIVFPVSFICF